MNLLAERRPWESDSLVRIDPVMADWLRRYCLGGPTTLIIADMEAVPGAMEWAGFHGRPNALWYTLSRSYAEWPWSPSAGDPDNHLSDQRRELHDCWSNYLDVVLAAMQAAPGTRATFLLNDENDRCGDVLSEYSLRQLSTVADRIERGRVFRPLRGPSTPDGGGPPP